MAMGKFKLALKDYELVSEMCMYIRNVTENIYVRMYVCKN